jgi:hypothetical protein
VVSVTLPIGELATRAAKAVSGVSQRRAERKARDEVFSAMRDFEARQLR